MEENKNIENRKLKNWLIYLMGGLGGILIGYDSGAITGVLHFIRRDFRMSSSTEGIVVSSLLVGAIIGSFLVGKLVKHVSRKNALIIFAVIFILGSLGSAFATGPYTLTLSRFLLGLSVGGASVIIPVYLAEIAPKNKRGKLVAINQLMVVLGILLAYFISYVFYNNAHAWNLTLGFSVLPAILLIVGTLLLPPSPRYLVMKGKIDEARKILLKLRNYDEKVVNADMKEIIDVAKRPEGHLIDLTKKIVRPAMVAGIGVAIATQLSGINSIMYYAPKILSVKNETQNTILFTTIIGFFNLLGTIVGMEIVDKLKRKQMLLGGMAGMFCGYFILATANFIGNPRMFVSLIGSVVVFFSYAISWGILVWIVISEMFPLYIRPRAVAVALGLNYFVNFLVALLFPIAVEKFSQKWIFTFFSIITLLIILFVKKFVIETGQISLEKIEKELMEKNK